MDIQEFINNFADQLDETTVDQLKADTRYRELPDWSSLVALSVIAMIDDEYDIILKGEEMRATNTIGELCNLVASKLS